MTGPMTRPSVPYWHIWTDDAGVGHQTRCELTGFDLKGVGTAAPQWNDPQEIGEATTVFTVQPVGWVGEWHENPAPQWIVPLSGRWWVEAMDGTRVEMGPGELSFGPPWRSARERIELLRRAQASRGLQLTFADHVHELNSSEGHGSRPEGLEPHHRSHLAFDRSMVLLNDVVEVLNLPELNLCVVV